MRSLDLHTISPATSTRAGAAPRARLVGAACVLFAALGLGGCSVSYPLFGAEEELKTGSITPAPAPVATAQPRDVVTRTPLAPPPGATAAVQASDAGRSASYAPRAVPAVAEADKPGITPSDWAYARGALTLAMGADAVNASVPWANPDTGAYGSFSASAGALEENGAMCRAFAASHSGGGHEQRLEGTACRTAAGHWEAVAIKTTASRTL